MKPKSHEMAKQNWLYMFLNPFLFIKNNLSKIAAGINNTGGKFATGINDTGGKFATGVNDTGGK
jgi:hypothetical protein